MGLAVVADLAEELDALDPAAPLRVLRILCPPHLHLLRLPSPLLALPLHALDSQHAIRLRADGLAPVARLGPLQARWRRRPRPGAAALPVLLAPPAWRASPHRAGRSAGRARTALGRRGAARRGGRWALLAQRRAQALELPLDVRLLGRGGVALHVDHARGGCLRGALSAETL